MTVIETLAKRPALSTVLHLDPATAEEIQRATTIVKQDAGSVELHFKAAGFEEPPKQQLVKYLDAEHSGNPLPLIPRSVFLIWYAKKTPHLFEAIVDATYGVITHKKELSRDFHGGPWIHSLEPPPS